MGWRILGLAVALAGCHNWESLSSGGPADMSFENTDLRMEEPDLSMGELDLSLTADLGDASVSPDDMAMVVNMDLLMCVPPDPTFIPDSGAQNLSVTGGPVTTTGGTHVIRALDIGGAAGNLRDGKLDLIALQHDTQRITALLGDGAGNFTSPMDSPIGVSEAADMVVGDFDEDGRPDVVVTLPALDQLGFMKGAGDGTFASPSPRPLEMADAAVPRNPHALAAGYFNGDAHLDLLVIEEGGPRASVFLGAGDGTFMEAGSQPVGASGAHHVLAADVDGDCLTDVVTTNFDTSNITVLLGNGDGTLRVPAASTHSVGGQPFVVASGDFNRDGLPDLVVSNYNDSWVSVLLGARPGLFASEKKVDVGAASRGLAVADFNGDHAPDIVLHNNIGILVLLGDGAGNFPASAPLAGIDGVDSLVAVDYSGDKRPDIAHGHVNGTNLYRYLNTSN